MKYLIVSDIHGSSKAFKTIFQVFNQGKFDYLILLGDILYHGPRNPLPEGHNPKEVAESLNQLKDKIIACRGNCDAEVDQLLLDFPVLSDYSFVVDNGVRIFCTHGHLYDSEKMPFSGVDVFLSGHTHVQVLEKKDNLVVCNPGSISLPKADSPAGYATYEDRKLSLFDMESHRLKELCF